MEEMKYGFSKDFLWGAASAAHQVEGAYLEEGKTAGIWDALWEGHTLNNENGNIAYDHYHRWKEDVALMKELGLKAYRFSVSWPRVIPERGKINEKVWLFTVPLWMSFWQPGSSRWSLFFTGICPCGPMRGADGEILKSSKIFRSMRRPLRTHSPTESAIG